MTYNYDRIKVWEDLIVNEDFVGNKVQSLQSGEVDEIYFKIDEGPALEHIKYRGENFIQWLKGQQVPHHRIKIETDNLVQDLRVWDRYIPYYNAEPFLYGQRINFITDKKATHRFGMFIGGYRWPRLYFASHMFAEHRDICLMSYNHRHLNLDALQDAIGDDGVVMNQVQRFSEHIPLLIDQQSDEFINFDAAYGICDHYNRIKIDLVFETWWQGQTFMPTEKTARPLLTETPFIVFGPKNYLMNLRRLGFKTFDGLIDETYDEYEGLERLQMMKHLVDGPDIDISKAADILSHNRQIYKHLSKNNFIEEFGCQ